MFRNIKLIFEADLGNPPGFLDDGTLIPPDIKIWEEYWFNFSDMHRLKLIKIEIEDSQFGDKIVE